MKKIRLSAGWDTSENLTKRLIRQFKTNDISLDDIEFVYDDNYDILIFFNYVNLKIKHNTKTFLFPHEPTFSGSHQKTFNDNLVVFGFEKDLYNTTCIETLAHTFYGGRGPWMDSLDFWCYENLKKYNFVKNKNISSSVTNLNTMEGINCLYPQRYKIADMVNNELPFIDVYGGWKNSPKREDALVDYMFNISIENEYQKNWISEKFYDNILTNTIPIYFGCKNIKEIYPEDGYILIEDINNIDEIKKTLKYINNNAICIYNEKIIGLKQIKEKYFKEFNLLKKIINL
jgi:hypothetical protein